MTHENRAIWTFYQEKGYYRIFCNGRAISISFNVPARAIRKEKPVYTEEDLKNCELKLDLGDKLEMYNAIWQEIKVK